MLWVPEHLLDPFPGPLTFPSEPSPNHTGSCAHRGSRRFPLRATCLGVVGEGGQTVAFPLRCRGGNTVGEVSGKFGDLPGLGGGHRERRGRAPTEDARGTPWRCRGQAQGDGAHELAPHALGRWWKEGVQR